MKKSFIDSSELDDEGEMKPSFIAEVLRRMRKEKSIPAEEVFKRFLRKDVALARKQVKEGKAVTLKQARVILGL